MRILTILLVSAGLLFLPGPLAAQGVEPDLDLPEAPEPGEVQINQPALPSVSQVVAQFTPGIQEVEFRGLDAQALNNATSLAVGLATATPGLPEGAKADFRTVTGQRFRLQNEEGELRARFEGFTLPTGVTPEAFAESLATAGQFARVRFRRLLVGDEVMRVEFRIRNGVAEVRVREDRSGRGHEGTSASINNERARDEGKDLDHSLRGRDRAEQERERHADRPDRDGRGRSGRSERLDRHERSGRH